jgi:hypothetical protein
MEACAAAVNYFVERMYGRESRGIEMLKPVRNDILNCRGGFALAPTERP